MQCFTVAEGRENGISVSETSRGMAILMLDGALYLDDKWSDEIHQIAKEHYGLTSLPIRWAKFAHRDGVDKLDKESKLSRSEGWNHALVLVCTGAGSGVNATVEYPRDVEVVHNGASEKLLVLKPGTGFRVLRQGDVGDAKRQLAFVWCWDMLLREVKLMPPPRQYQQPRRTRVATAEPEPKPVRLAR